MSDDPRAAAQQPQAGYNPTPRRSLADSLGFTHSAQPASPVAPPRAQPVYDDPNTPPAKPTGQMPARTSPLAHLPTDVLSRMQRDMRSIIPSDPTFLAHVGVILRSLIQNEISDPARIEADKQALAVQQQAAADKLAAGTAARHEQEKATLAASMPAQPTPADERQQHALAVKHQEELNAIERENAVTALAAKQAQDAKDFAILQQKQRDALAAEFNAQIADPQGAPAI
jgi:hypothetical protein